MLTLKNNDIFEKQKKTVRKFFKNRPKDLQFIGDLSKQDADIIRTYARNASSILEFGAGGSTQIICRAKKRTTQFISIDTSREWIDRTKKNLQLLSIKADVTFSLYRDWEHSTAGKTFDLIFNDGFTSCRTDFAIQAWDYLSVGGSFLIHDTRTGRYIRTVAVVVKKHYLEIDSLFANTNHSNITVIKKKAKEPYSNWNRDETKQPWEYGQGDVPCDY